MKEQSLALNQNDIDFRVKVTDFLDRLGVFTEEGLLPDGSGVATYVPRSGRIDYKSIEEAIGTEAVGDLQEKVNSYHASHIQEDPWSRKTEKAQNRYPGGRFSRSQTDIQRGTGRHS